QNGCVFHLPTFNVGIKGELTYYDRCRFGVAQKFRTYGKSVQLTNQNSARAKKWLMLIISCFTLGGFWVA
ncbi:MAG: hypothetical protein ABIG32_01250, partial [Candidatus Uhrbacteria bacterium]